MLSVLDLVMSRYCGKRYYYEYMTYVVYGICISWKYIYVLQNLLRLVQGVYASIISYIFRVLGFGYMVYGLRFNKESSVRLC